MGLRIHCPGRFDGQGVKIVRKHVPPTLWLFLLLFVACPSAAAGQDRSLTDVLTFLMTTQAVQTADVVRDREAAIATRDTIARSLLLELATLPIASSSSAFTLRSAAWNVEPPGPDSVRSSSIVQSRRARSTSRCGVTSPVKQVIEDSMDATCRMAPS